MSTIPLTDRNVIRVRWVLIIGLIAILILANLALIAGAISDIVSSPTWQGYQADRIPVARNLMISISAPTPPAVDIQSVPSETSIPVSVVAHESSVVPIPVSTPPL